MKTMTLKFVLIGLGLICAPAFGQSSADLDKCLDSAKTQPEINACAFTEQKRVEAELAQKYGRLAEMLAADASTMQKLKAMQSAWVVYRDSYMETVYPKPNKEVEYGTNYRASAALFRARLTQHQVAAIDMLLEERKPK
jgi:uncharacterized protein YecT (DUF1311 family)